MRRSYILFATFSLLPFSAASAATLDTRAVARNHNSPISGSFPEQVVDLDSTDGISSSIVESSISGSGTVGRDIPSAGLSAGDEFNSSSATASINYSTGELEAVAEAQTTPFVKQGFNSGGNAEATLSDAISFYYDPLDPLLDINTDTVTFQWFVEWEITGLGLFDTFFQINDTDPATGGFLYQADEQFANSGSKLYTFDILLADLPSVIALHLQINASAQTRCDFGCEDISNWWTYSLVDAGSTGIFNIITPEGVTYEGTGIGFLSDMRVIGDDGMGVVPLPAGLPLLLGGLAALGILKRRKI